MRYPLPWVLPFLALICTPAVQAQAPPDSGARVRITNLQIPHGRTVGVLERFTDDTVVVSGQAISRTAISRFEVSMGRKSHWLAGMAVGFVAGAGLGAVSCAVLCGQNYDEDLKGVLTLFVAGIGGATGLLVGGIVGASTHGERWRAMSLSTLRIEPTVRSNGTFGITVGLRF